MPIAVAVRWRSSAAETQGATRSEGVSKGQGRRKGKAAGGMASLEVEDRPCVNQLSAAMPF